jgi:transposase
VAVGDQADDGTGGDGRVAALEAALAGRDARLAELAASNAELVASNAELTAKVEALTKQVEVLTELLNRNSKNSHLPPSSDGPGAGSREGRAARNKRKAERRRGGQKGHRGSHRELLPADRVHSFVDLFPEACLGCARSLPRLPDAAACRYQQLELRDHRPHLTEWRRHEVQCKSCGASTRAAYHSAKIPSSAFGPCLTATVALLTGAYHLSRRKTQKLLSELFGIAVSLGAISAMEQRASKALASAHDEALREVQYAGVKHADATTWTRAGKLMSLWTMASEAVTVYRIFADGCRETILPMFGPRLGFLVSDRATVFGFWAMPLRQVCHAHLLRKYVAFYEREGPAGSIGHELLELTSLLFEYWHGFKQGHLTRQELQFWMRPVQRDIERTLERGAAADIERMSGSCVDILAHREALWTFVEHDGLEPTNNHAELELRDFVLWRKRSFGSQSERGERFAERVMTAVRTARKQGKGVLDFLVCTVRAHVSGAQLPRLLGSEATA